MRTIVDIPEDEIERLDRMARKNKRSRAAEVREAVRAYLRNRTGQDWISRGAGYWSDRDDIGDSVEYQRNVREDRDVA